jgi:hypothetical protein
MPKTNSLIKKQLDSFNARAFAIVESQELLEQEVFKWASEDLEIDTDEIDSWIIFDFVYNTSGPDDLFKDIKRILKANKKADKCSRT